VGEIAGGLMSAWIIVGALRHRVPIRRVARMVFYVILDMTVGSIPVLGTIFDWLFEENVMNMESLLRYRDRRQPPRSLAEIAGAATVIFAIIIATALVMIAAVAAVVVWLIRQR
jgi:hypothetical protein